MSDQRDLFDLQALEQSTPAWFTPSKVQPKCARNVAVGKHPMGFPLLEQRNTDATCGDCRHLVVREWSGRWFKCAQTPMSRCRASDIRKKWAACQLFAPTEQPQGENDEDPVPE